MPGTFTNLLYHVVFSTKQRRPLIRPDLQTELYAYLGGIIRDEGGILLKAGGMPDHVHLLIKLKPSMALAEILRKMKANSSKWMSERSETLQKFGWQEGYSAFTVSESQFERVRNSGIASSADCVFG